jgi:hypothetical protein
VPAADAPSETISPTAKQYFNTSRVFEQIKKLDPDILEKINETIKGIYTYGMWANMDDISREYIFLLLYRLHTTPSAGLSATVASSGPQIHSMPPAPVAAPSWAPFYSGPADGGRRAARDG